MGDASVSHCNQNSGMMSTDSITLNGLMVSEVGAECCGHCEHFSKFFLQFQTVKTDFRWLYLF